jgi:hypothetical protein
MNKNLDGFAAWDAEIVSHKIGARDARRLRLRPVRHEGACGDQRRRHDQSRFHWDLLASCWIAVIRAQVEAV